MSKQPLTIAYSYSRWSSAAQSDGDSERRQREMRERWLARHPTVKLDENLTMTDRGLSQYSGEALKRGELGVFLAALRAGKIKPGFLLVEAIDRLVRLKNLPAISLISEVVQAGIAIVTLEDGKIYSEDTLNDSDSSIDTLVKKIQGAREYSDRIGRRVRDAVAERQEQARVDKRPRTRMCPFGYRWIRGSTDQTQDGHFEIVEERAQVIRRIFREAIERPGRGGIAQRLNEDKIPPFDKGGMGLKQKKPGKIGTGGAGDGWHRAMVLRVLQNRSYTGEYQPARRNTGNGFKKESVGEPIAGYYPTIIDAATFARAQALRSTVKTGGRAIRIFDNMLRGLCKCGSCGRTLHYKILNVSGKTYEYLVCPSATKHTCANVTHHRYPELESRILSAVLSVSFDKSDFEDQDNDVRNLENQIAQVNDEIRKDDKKYSGFENADWGDDGLPDRVQRSMTDILKRIAGHEKRIEKLRAEISKLKSAQPTESINAVRELRAVACGTGEGRVEARQRIHTALSQMIDGIVCEADKTVRVNVGGGAYTHQWKASGEYAADYVGDGLGERGETFNRRRDEKVIQVNWVRIRPKTSV